MQMTWQVTLEFDLWHHYVYNEVDQSPLSLTGKLYLMLLTLCVCLSQSEAANYALMKY